MQKHSRDLRADIIVLSWTVFLAAQALSPLAALLSKQVCFCMDDVRYWSKFNEYEPPRHDRTYAFRGGALLRLQATCRGLHR